MTAGDSEPAGMGAPGDKSQGLSKSKDLPAVHGWVYCALSELCTMQEGKEMHLPQPASELLHAWGMSLGVHGGSNPVFRAPGWGSDGCRRAVVGSGQKGLPWSARGAGP